MEVGVRRSQRTRLKPVCKRPEETVRDPTGPWSPPGVWRLGRGSTIDGVPSGHPMYGTGDRPHGVREFIVFVDPLSSSVSLQSHLDDTLGPGPPLPLPPTVPCDLFRTIRGPLRFRFWSSTRDPKGPRGVGVRTQSGLG